MYKFEKIGTKVAVVLSGGLDSSIVTGMLAKEHGAENVIAVTYNYGQKQSIEVEKAGETCKNLGIEHKVIDISFLGEIVAPVCANIAGSDINVPNIKEVLGDPQPPTYVPFRNLILLSLSLSFAEANGCEAVYTGLQAHDQYGYWDTTPTFVENMNSITDLNRQTKIPIVAPFINLSKGDELEIAKQYDLDLSTTLTCYDPDGDISCGICPSCAERIKGFIDAGIKDPVPYAIDIPWEDLGVK